MTRTTSQIAASRSNGRMSTGPVTPEGRTTSSRNAVRHGLTASAVLLPGETIEGYEAMVAAWTDTLRPRSPGEAQLVARIADLQFRSSRVVRYERDIVDARLERDVAKTDECQALRVAQEAREASAALASLLVDVIDSVGIEHLLLLVPALRRVVSLAAGVDGIAQGLVPTLDAAVDDIICSTSVSTDPGLLVALRNAAQEIATAVAAVLPERERDVAAVRQRLVGASACEDDADARRVTRYVAQLDREMARVLDMLRVVRELGVAPALGSLGASVRVEVHAVGARHLAQR